MCLLHYLILSDGAGYKHISISPNPDKRFGFLKAEIDTQFGKLSTHWYYKDNEICFEFKIPNGITAQISLPDGRCETVFGGEYIYWNKKILKLGEN